MTDETTHIARQADTSMPKRTFADVVHTIIEGEFYQDYDQSAKDLGILRDTEFRLRALLTERDAAQDEVVRLRAARPSLAGDERVARLVKMRAAAICEAIELRDFDAAHELARTMPAALSAMNTPAQGGGWHPIETCPIDTDVLIWESGDICRAAIRTSGDDPYWECMCTQPVVYTPAPTHWMPLPVPPAAMKDGG